MTAPLQGREPTVEPPVGTGAGSSNSEPKNLRYAVMIHSEMLPAWQAAALDQLEQVEGVELALVIVDNRCVPSKSPRHRLSRLVGSHRGMWDAYNNGWVARKAAALQRVDRSQTLAGVDRLAVDVHKDGYSEFFPDDAVRQIRDLELDFIVRFAFGIIRGEILDAAREGVWSFHHGDELLFRGSPPAFWEVVESEPVTGAVLQRLTDRLDGGVVLEKGWVDTQLHSYVANIDSTYSATSHFIARAARRVQMGFSTAGLAPTPTTAPIYKVPTNRRVVRFLAHQALRTVARQIRGTTEANHWRIGIVREDAGEVASTETLSDPVWLPLDRVGRAYAADPFILAGSDPQVLLYERYDTRRRIGEIWQARLDGSGRPAKSTLPIEVHASYPFTFVWEGRTLCIPQVSADGTPAFELIDDQWLHVGDLLPDTQVLDPTVFRFDGLWWMLGTLPGANSLDHLHGWFADSPLGPWEPHYLNPLKTDVRSARPAGGTFTDGGGVLRPTQDCAGGYGSAITICRIDELSKTGFSETAVRRIAPPPGWGAAGTHTLTGDHDVTVFDSHWVVRDLHASRAELLARWRRVADRLRR